MTTLLWLTTMAQWALWDLCTMPALCVLLSFAIVWHSTQKLKCNP